VEGYERRIAALEAEVAQLKGEIGELKEQLGRNSQNSARPPTLEGPGVNRKPPREPAGRQRGAQLGQPGQPRVWLPVEQVSEVSVGKPTPWRRGGGALPGGDPQPQRHQGIEVPPPAPQVSDYQLHRLPWARCGIRPCGTGPAGVPPVGYGPRWARLGALGSGAYRRSKRRVVSFCPDVLGVPRALGEICQIEQAMTAALAPCVQEARAYVQAQDANGEETPWRQPQHRAGQGVRVTQGVSVVCRRASRGRKGCGNCWVKGIRLC